MSRSLPSVVVLAVLMLASVALLACSPDEDEATVTPIVPTAPITLTASPEPTEQPVNTEEPGSLEPRRSGDPELDAIIEAVESRDIATLAPIVEYTTVGCTFAQGLGGPPKCEEGQEEGEPVRMFPLASCEGEWTRFGIQTVAQFAQRTAGLWGVIDVDRYWESTDGWETPNTFLAFHTESPSEDYVSYLEVAEGRIVRASFGCGGSLQDLLTARAAAGSMQLSLAAGPWDQPAERPSVTAPSTGIEEVDGILSAVASYDWDILRRSALDAMEGLPDYACEEPPLQGPGGVECDPKNGETADDPVSVFPVAYCEGALVRDPADSVRAVLDQVPSLHAVVEAPAEPSESDLYRHGAYWIVYELQGGPDQASSAVRLHVAEDGDLTAIWFGCLPSAEELAQWDQQPLPEVPLRGE